MKQINIKNALTILIISLLSIGCNSNKDTATIKLTKKEQIISDKKYVYKYIDICQGCHGSSFGKKALGKSLIVRDMTREHIYQALIGYKNNSYGRSNKELMKRHVDRYTLGQLQQMANLIVKE